MSDWWNESEAASGSDPTMSLVELCRYGDLNGEYWEYGEYASEQQLAAVKAALHRGDDVNSTGEYGWTALMWAVTEKHNSVVELLLKTPNIDVNQKDDNEGCCALHLAVTFENNEALKLLLNVPNIDVNIVETDGESAVHMAVLKDNIEALKLLLDVPNIDVNIEIKGGEYKGMSAVHMAAWLNNNIEVLKLLLSHPSLTALTLNQKNEWYGATPVMWAVIDDKLEHLELLAADLRVDLDTTDKEGRSLEERARWLLLVEFLLKSRDHKL